MTIKKGLRRKRPFGVWALIVMQSASLLATGVVLVAYVASFTVADVTIHLDATQTDIVLMTLQFILSTASIVGLVLMRRWGWYLTMLDLGISMVSDFYLYYTGDPNYWGMFINVIVVFYLSQREVQNAFHQRKREKSSVLPLSAEAKS